MRRKQIPNIKTTLSLALLWTHLIISLILFLTSMRSDPRVFELVSANIFDIQFQLAFRFDALSSPIYFMVSILGVSIGHFSLRHLHGEKRQTYFYTNMTLLITSVSAFVLSNDLVMLLAAWMITSYFLHKLLTFYPDRPNALSAAYKKQLVSRVADIAILSATILILYHYGTSSLSEIFLLASEIDSFENSSVFNIASILIVLGALAKSAQYPFHFWLPETMETPAPVSALMHAGIINAGGYLIIRFSPLIHLSTMANAILIFMGTLTAIYTALIMMTQNNIKMKLAYSTISQMGIMIFACGIGAYSIALFHIIAHSFYKAYAFLSTGFLIEESKKLSLKLKSVPVPAFIISVALGFILVTVGASIHDGQHLSFYAYAAILVISMTQNWFALLDHSVDHVKLYFSIGAILTLAATFYITIEVLFTNYLMHTLPDSAISSRTALENLALIYVSLAAFSAGLWLSRKLMPPQTEMMKRIYMHLWNGGYSRLYVSYHLAKIFPRYPGKRQYPFR